MPRHFGWNAFAFGFGPRGFWGGPRGGGRRRQWFESGDMKYVILKLVKDKPRHGYEVMRSEEHTSELQSQSNLVCRLLLEKKKKKHRIMPRTRELTQRDSGS